MMSPTACSWEQSGPSAWYNCANILVISVIFRENILSADLFELDRILNKQNVLPGILNVPKQLNYLPSLPIYLKDFICKVLWVLVAVIFSCGYFFYLQKAGGWRLLHLRQRWRQRGASGCGPEWSQGLRIKADGMLWTRVPVRVVHKQCCFRACCTQTAPGCIWGGPSHFCTEHHHWAQPSHAQQTSGILTVDVTSSRWEGTDVSV